MDLGGRPDVVKTVNGIIDRIVKDEARREKVKTAVAEFGSLPAEHLVADDEDFLLAIKAIRFFPITTSMRNWLTEAGWKWN